MVGRPKGTNKSFGEFSKSKRPLSLKILKRKREENELSKKKKQIDRSEFSQEKEIITIGNEDFSQGSIASDHNKWIKTDNLTLNIEAKALIECRNAR